MSGPALRGEVQQFLDGRWRTVLTPSGIAVNDRRRQPGPQEAAPVVEVFDGGLVRLRRPGRADVWGFDGP